MLFGGALGAADFAITVPVAIRGLPAYDEGRVECGVTTQPGSARELDVLGRGFATFRIQGGIFSGEVVVNIDVIEAAAYRIAEAREYFCSLQIRNTRTSAGGVASVLVLDRPDARLQPGAPFRPHVSGPIPR